ncbi:MAG TPA: hypothetical protein ENF75_07330 [Acidilobales archaeon]|nr:hypothetical protein [Acidilobales archaeon]
MSYEITEVVPAVSSYPTFITSSIHLGTSLIGTSPCVFRLKELSSLSSEFRRVFSSRLLTMLNDYVNKLLSDFIEPLLNTKTPDLDNVFTKLLSEFSMYLSTITSVLNAPILALKNEEEIVSELSKLVSLEERVYSLIANEVRRRGSKVPNDVEGVVYGLAMLIDYDLWVINKLSKYGLHGLIERLQTRALNELSEAVRYKAALTYLVTATLTAILGIVTKYNMNNLSKLIKWTKKYAEELDDYIDTLDVLVEDELYSEVMKYLGK